MSKVQFFYIGRPLAEASNLEMDMGGRGGGRGRGGVKF